ncbi:uncharacterized protein LOC104581264 [Brachypodium distachyon]|uniref:uncharacterized protein LOC104581264 n=1 Tax=Brachypodium distachyon TaxID=15368 RepID=UPI00052FF871|nr:uncharacterized protein LOC104581264 [Brachypodium distachyon]|eukprot:XP_010240752.1 uncharacterized protein LOC104581264 [Brachypodium distachyon]
MSSSASSSSPAGSNPVGTVQEKLMRNNYLLWKVQVLPAIRGAHLMGYINRKVEEPPAELTSTDDNDKKVSNPAYVAWVINMETSHEIWEAIEQMFSSSMLAKLVNTRIALATTPKGNMTVTEYFAKIKSFGDEMASVGKPLGEDDLVSYVLAGLDFDYNSLVSAIFTRVEPIKMADLYSPLMGFESRLNLLQGQAGGQVQSSANAVTRGGGSGGRGGYNNNRGRGGNNGGDRNRGNDRGNDRGNYNNGSGSGGYNNNNSGSKPRC